MTDEQRVQLAVEWFSKLDDPKKQEAFRRLIEIGIEQDWIGVWSPEDRADLANESGNPIEEYAAPYFTSCGEPLIR